MADTKEKKYVSDNAQLMAEWDWEKNNELGLYPDKLTCGSGKKVWWKCSNVHEWEATIASRNSGRGCPYCARQKILTGQNDLLTLSPKLAGEWHYEKNNGLTPSNVMPNSNIKVWWECRKGHEWQAVIAHRYKGSGCPYCTGQKVLIGQNDLLTINPTLAKEWNYEKNGDLRPEEVSANSHKKVWWICSQGHEWQAYISNRSKGIGCPYCAGQKVLPGQNDLLTINPALASEWNYEKNNGLMPSDVMARSGKAVWWKCKEGHEWQATITNRNKGRGCPYCAGKKVLLGYNDLETINPTLAKEWNYEKNGDLKPQDFTANSNKSVWWRCNKGHEWKASIYHRNSGQGCPFCSSEQQASFPEFALLFYLNKYGLDTLHSYKEKGYELDIYIPSKKIAIEYDGYYWHKDKTKQDLIKNYKCKKDDIKLIRIRERLPSLNDSSIDYLVQIYTEDFPKIIKIILSDIAGVNADVNLERDAVAIESMREHLETDTSLLYSNPELAKEWNFEKNCGLRPEHFSSNSGSKVW